MSINHRDIYNPAIAFLFVALSLAFTGVAHALVVSNDEPKDLVSVRSPEEIAAEEAIDRIVSAALAVQLESEFETANSAADLEGAEDENLGEEVEVVYVTTVEPTPVSEPAPVAVVTTPSPAVVEDKSSSFAAEFAAQKAAAEAAAAKRAEEEAAAKKAAELAAQKAAEEAAARLAAEKAAAEAARVAAAAKTAKRSRAS